MILPNPGGKVGHRRTHRITPHNCVGGDSIFAIIRGLAFSNCRRIGVTRILWHVVSDRQGGSDERRPRRTSNAGGPRRGPRDQRSAPRSSGPDRARRSQPQHTPDAEPPRPQGPPIPPEIEARQLAPEVRRELTTLDRATADVVARHLVAAGELLDEDPEAALAHARAAPRSLGPDRRRPRGGGNRRIPLRRLGQALAELRAARRMGSKSPLLALIADCERGVGRPERAIELARGPEAAELTGDDADELRIVVAGARSDLGQREQALAILSTPQLDPKRTGQTAARLVLRLRRDTARGRPGTRGAAVVHQRGRRGCRRRDRRRRAHHGAHLT